MYLLLEKSTGIIKDIQSQPFGIDPSFEWVEDKSITDRTFAGKAVYNKQTKETTLLPAEPLSPRPISNNEIIQKLNELDAKLETKAEPKLGGAEGVIAPTTYHFEIILAIAVVGLLGIFYIISKHFKK